AGCNGPVGSEFALCGSCWVQVPIISGPICQSCGIPILADSVDDTDRCEDCTNISRPWTKGRAAIQYQDLGRRLILGLKHSDRQDVAVTVMPWMTTAARDLIQDDTILAPIPLHWSRLMKRRYNQAALLSQNLGLKLARTSIPDLLVRPRKTAPLDGVSVAERFDRLAGAIEMNPKRTSRIAGKPVLLIDDVMTSGATLSAGTHACLNAGASRVDVLVLARVGKDDYMTSKPFNRKDQL
ncbi:MAG: ComF family protein, partial [Paracoccaceae bacterium]